MKYVIFTVILTITTTPIYAQDWNRFSYGLEFCQRMYNLAEDVMAARQKGIPRTEIMRAITPILNDPGTTPETRRHIMKVINDAYQYPIHPSSRRDLQSLAISSFRQRIRLECLEEFR